MEKPEKKKRKTAAPQGRSFEEKNRVGARGTRTGRGEGLGQLLLNERDEEERNATGLAVADAFKRVQGATSPILIPGRPRTPLVEIRGESSDGDEEEEVEEVPMATPASPPRAFIPPAPIAAAAAAAPVANPTKVRGQLSDLFTPGKPGISGQQYPLVCHIPPEQNDPKHPTTFGGNAPGGGHFNTQDHLRRYHPKLLEQAQQSIRHKATKSELLDLVLPLLNNPKKRLEVFFRRAAKDPTSTKQLVHLVLWAIRQSIPWSAFTGPEWLGFCHAVTLSPVSETTLRDQFVEALFNHVTKAIKDALAGLSSISATSDAWSSLDKHLVAVSATGVTRDWKLETVVLDCEHVEGPLTADVLEVIISGVVDAHTKDTVLFASMTTDGGANFVKAASKIVGTENRLVCVSHTLNLVAKTAVEDAELSGLIGDVANLATFFSFGQPRLLLALLQQKAGKPQLVPIRAVETRWFSSLDMVNRYLLLHPEISQALESLSSSRFKPPRLLSPLELDSLSHLATSLNPLQQLCITSQSRQYLLCNVAPALCQLIDNLGDSVLDQHLRRRLRDKFDPMLLNGESLLLAATAFHPQYASFAFLARHCERTNTNHTKLVEAIWTRVKKEALLPAFQIADFEPSQSDEMMTMHVRLFRDQIVKNREGINEPLAWWQRASQRLPHLIPLAKAMLCLQASSAESERFWSTVGNVHEGRESLTPLHLSQLALIRFWLSTHQEKNTDILVAKVMDDDKPQEQTK